jgi:cytochrome P450 family 97 subfamily B polypeptide 3
LPGIATYSKQIYAIATHEEPGVLPHPLAGYRPEASPSALYPNEVTSDFAFIPFGGGARKCVGDQFAMFEAAVAMSMLLRRFRFRLPNGPESVGMATGATIHTANGLVVKVERRVTGASAAAQVDRLADAVPV